jgi:lipoprotein signal peptidase
MNPLRQIIGILVIVIFAIPSLFGIIWAVGLTRAAISPELLSDLPQEVIREVPYFIDDVYKSAQDEDIKMNHREREWFQAARQAGISPRNLMKEIGFLDWLEKELSHAIQEIGEILRGEIPPKPVILDFRPLKKAFNHEAVDRDFNKILNKLPACNAEETQIWENAAQDEYFSDTMPACNPDHELAEKALRNFQLQISEDIPDEVDIFKDTQYLPKGISLSKTVVSLTYLLFLIPIFFIVIGSLIGSSSKSGFLRYSGISTIVGGGLALLLALFARNITPFFANHFHYQYSHEISIGFQRIVLDNLGNIFGVILDKLFSPVIAVAGTVCVVGVIFFALSFAFTSETENKKLT